MKLGKRFTRLKRRYNAGSITMSFTKHGGEVLKPHRKLNMLLVLSFYGKISNKAMKNEFDKMNLKNGKQEK